MQGNAIPKPASMAATSSMWLLSKKVLLTSFCPLPTNLCVCACVHMHQQSVNKPRQCYTNLNVKGQNCVCGLGFLKVQCYYLIGLHEYILCFIFLNPGIFKLLNPSYSIYYCVITYHMSYYSY